MDRSRVTLFGALAVMTLAQSMEAIQPVYSTYYIGRASRGYIPNAGTPVTTLVQDGVGGWAEHPIAGILLLALAALFLFNINLGPAWMRYRYWVACAALVVCLIPFSVEGREWGNGEVIGIAAIAVAAVSALMHKKVT